jgi:GNAT superfamily N-acetyltransferase
MDFVIGNKEDINGILELYKQLDEDSPCFCDIEEANKIWDSFNKYNIKYYLAKDDGKIIGSLYICIIPDLSRNGKSIGFIENVITDEKYRNKGIGKKLMEMAIDYSKENNCYKVILQSGAKRTDAHRFYERLGFDGELIKAFDLRI